VRKPDGVFILKTEDVIYFQAQGDFVKAVDQQHRPHILNLPLHQIESQISPKQFFRINRSEMINMEFVLKYSTYKKNRLAISLDGVDHVLYTSNSRTPEFRIWIES